jgi:phosphoribosylanthranilate isomerase
MSVKVKICGMTNREDALVAADAGADAIGFIFYEKSPRFVSIPAAAKIVPALPPHLIKVGVFVNAPEDFVLEAITNCGLNLLQFHGDEAPDYCVQFGLMSMKAFQIRDNSSLAALTNYKTDAWLLDAHSPDQLGGTGQSFNWDLAIQAQQHGKPIFLAGGLTPENVSQAIAYVHPYAVDVSSGVEKSPGKKDHEKVKNFIGAAKTVPERLQEMK